MFRYMTFLYVMSHVKIVILFRMLHGEQNDQFFNSFYGAGETGEGRDGYPFMGIRNPEEICGMAEFQMFVSFVRDYVVRAQGTMQINKELKMMRNKEASILDVITPQSYAHAMFVYGNTCHHNLHKFDKSKTKGDAPEKVHSKQGKMQHLELGLTREGIVQCDNLVSQMRDVKKSVVWNQLRTMWEDDVKMRTPVKNAASMPSLPEKSDEGGDRGESEEDSPSKKMKLSVDCCDIELPEDHADVGEMAL